ncbi:MAG: hypothetical protein JSW06_00605 [Thermoplasmatales archaeon]|nr:MAG: hypothetical protein JSW06_00605 [Thermoplasmatales archaeon]
MEEIEESEEETSRMFLDRKEPMTLDEELAFFMHRFNSDIETIECMPAFEDHLNELFPERKKEIVE